MAIRLDKDKIPLIPPHGTPCENIDDLQSAITTKGGEIKKYIMDSLLRAIRDNEWANKVRKVFESLETWWEMPVLSQYEKKEIEELLNDPLNKEALKDAFAVVMRTIEYKHSQSKKAFDDLVAQWLSNTDPQLQEAESKWQRSLNFFNNLIMKDGNISIDNIIQYILEGKYPWIDNSNNFNSPIQSRLDAIKKKYPDGLNKEKVDKIKITTDGKVEMMGRKFFVLQPKDEKEDIKNGIVRGDASRWMGDQRYFTAKAAMQEVDDKQGRKLFDTKEDVEAFIENFPGDTLEERIYSFASLFFGNESSGLPKQIGSWNPNVLTNKRSYHYNSVTLSRTDQYGRPFGVGWYEDTTVMKDFDPNFAIPVTVSEPC